ncbi:MAG: hypothetical protein UU37_C0001G0002 [Candidatus Gottesmanbacteria bacterium GW2011_GWA2_41_12]|uniref:Glycosyltransferase RgtA/B/C/D-like domain-containing protein n=2 Tax=Candidatus Gottesmaniibacteriota TaxID=1752720 RepID=A0A0G0UIH2_9BACT|nr:MAG: hypothetical protein UT63_C0002G0022 [Candidatus Gottesmanbacteria bacterium GW2011_GWC2_39_8]KKR88583.1 MAG: hypothetical protein UU37_C0001G0002 [Candidatus Gottesmanbacteria bacterium GW2011_GWA2_41_12]
MKILPNNMYLLAGRLPVVLFGFFGLIGIYKLTKLLFDKKTAFIAALLFIISPFVLLYDRMALFDGMLSAMLIWTVYFSLKSSKSGKVTDAVYWGIFMGLSFLSKPTAIIFLIFTPLCYLIYKLPLTKKKFKPSIIHILLAIGIGELLNNMQRVSKVYFMMDLKNQQFRQPLAQLISNPFALTWGNLQGFFSWIVPYYTLPIFISGLIAFLILFITKKKQALVLFLLWFFPIFVLATAGREIFPRYILFTAPYFFITLSTLILNSIKVSKNILVRVFIIIIVGILFIPSVKFDYFLLTDPSNAPMPITDYNQYVSEHPSGYGLNTIFSYLDNETKNKKVTIVTEGTFGLYPYAFNLYYWNNKNVTIIPRWPLSFLDQEILDAAKTSKVYVILKEKEKIPEGMPVTLILKADKPGGKYPILLTTLSTLSP